jgi:hypothetical protein
VTGGNTDHYTTADLTVCPNTALEQLHCIPDTQGIHAGTTMVRKPHSHLQGFKGFPIQRVLNTLYTQYCVCPSPAQAICECKPKDYLQQFSIQYVCPAQGQAAPGSISSIRVHLTMTAVGFEPTPLRTGALSQRLRPLGQTVMEAMCEQGPF